MRSPDAAWVRKTRWDALSGEDQERRTVWFYRPGETPEEYHGPASLQGTGPVAGFELVLGKVWL